MNNLNGEIKVGSINSFESASIQDSELEDVAQPHTAFGDIESMCLQHISDASYFLIVT